MTAPCGAPGIVNGPITVGHELGSGAGGAIHTRAHRCYLALGASPEAVPYARRCTRQALAAWGLASIADDAELIVSELVANARAAVAGTKPAVPVVLYLAADPDRLTVLMWDASPHLPVWRHPDDDATTGRGLAIVQALSDTWGTCVPVADGKVVWSRLSLDRSPQREEAE